MLQIQNMMDINVDLLQWFTNKKKSANHKGTGTHFEHQSLSDKLHKAIIKKPKKHKTFFF